MRLERSMDFRSSRRTAPRRQPERPRSRQRIDTRSASAPLEKGEICCFGGPYFVSLPPCGHSVTYLPPRRLEIRIRTSGPHRILLVLLIGSPPHGTFVKVHVIRKVAGKSPIFTCLPSTTSRSAIEAVVRVMRSSCSCSYSAQRCSFSKLCFPACREFSPELAVRRADCRSSAARGNPAPPGATPTRIFEDEHEHEDEHEWKPARFSPTIRTAWGDL
jgi:hypothetical protein